MCALLETSAEGTAILSPDNLLNLITQGGSTAILLLVLSRLWKEYLKQSAWMRKKIDEQDGQIRALAHHMGMSTQDLTRSAKELREKFGQHIT